MMNRRESVKRMALGMTGILSASTLGYVLNGCATQEQAAPVGIFSGEQMTLIREMADLIIPKTDTPGALEAGVPEFVAMMVEECYPAEAQQEFKTGLDALAQRSKTEMGGDFADLAPEKKVELLTKVDQEAFDAREENKPHFFRTMKDLTVLGYFTSEPGTTQALNYVPVPGKYEGCIEYKPGDKAYAM